MENVTFANVIKVFLKEVGGGGCPYSNWFPDRKTALNRAKEKMFASPAWSTNKLRTAKDHQGLPVAIRSRGVA